MSLCTFKKIVITNRRLCDSRLTDRLGEIIGLADMVILREKDMSENDYELLAKDVIDLCKKNDKLCVLHSFTDVARRLNHKAIHLPMGDLRRQARGLCDFNIIGASVHSLEEAMEAESLSASYIVAGHIFPTDCKAGLLPRGTEFLKEICENVHIPVYALGGINDNNEELVKKCGADGACRMSGYMRS